MPQENGSSPLNESGSAADSQFSQKPPSQTVKECSEKTWVAIELLDEEGNPVAGESYILQLPDGSIMEGNLDESGKAGANNIDPGQCKICFPRFDGRVWRPL
jgi:hypothetical protein